MHEVVREDSTPDLYTEENPKEKDSLQPVRRVIIEEKKNSRLTRFLKTRKASIQPWYFRILCEFYTPALIAALINLETVGNDSGVLVTFSIFLAYLVIFVFVSVPMQMTFCMLEDFIKRPEEETLIEREKRLKASYAILFEEVKTYRMSQVLYYPIYFCKQLAMVSIVILLRGSPLA